MSQLVVLVSIAALSLARAAPEGDAWPLALAGMALAHAVLWARTRLLLRRVDRGDLFALRSADLWAEGVRLADLALFVYALLSGGWLSAARSLAGDLVLVDDVIALAPIVLALAGVWWTQEPVARRVREAMFMRELDAGGPIYPSASRPAWVWFQMRHQALFLLVPLALISAWSESVERFWPGEPGLSLDATRLAGALALLAVTPAIIVRVWSTVPLARGPLLEHLRSLARAQRVRVGSVRVWRTHGSLANAAVLGVLPRPRYLVISDLLLESLNADEVDAVVRHEFAHLRKRHMAWLGVIVASSACVAVLLATLAERAMPALASPDSGEVLRDPATLAGAIDLGLVVLTGVLVFGAFMLASRTFEWQADAFAASSASRDAGSAVVRPEDAHVVAHTLGRIAHLNGVSSRRPSWRHGSIGLRQRRLGDLAGLPLGGLPIDRRARVIAWGGLAVGLASLAGVLLLGA
ncbi:MAG: M48 family metalloprotease [Phycisphaerales bacterium]|jgi:STE24 endopeptidase|nr:M48 family metalloprotease [Phycisphaerales bacterium]